MTHAGMPLVIAIFARNQDTWLNSSFLDASQRLMGEYNMKGRGSNGPLWLQANRQGAVQRSKHSEQRLWHVKVAGIPNVLRWEFRKGVRRSKNRSCDNDFSLHALVTYRLLSGSHHPTRILYKLHSRSNKPFIGFYLVPLRPTPLVSFLGKLPTLGICWQKQTKKQTLSHHR
jgi:hypothetical protein